MSKRSAESQDVKYFVKMYRNFTHKQLEDEFNAISDQCVAMLEVLNCASIEVLYDGVDSLFMEFRKGKAQTSH